MTERPVPRTPLQEAMGHYTHLVREVSDAGLRTVGPMLTAAILEFAAKSVEQHATIDGKWNAEQAAEWRRALQVSLDELKARWIARHAARRPA